jgi:hypothetical protein
MARDAFIPAALAFDGSSKRPPAGQMLKTLYALEGIERISGGERRRQSQERASPSRTCA